MKVGLATAHGGFEMKEKVSILLGKNSHEVTAFRNLQCDKDNEDPIVVARIFHHRRRLSARNQRRSKE